MKGWRSQLKLYHGTSYSRGIQILDDKKIKGSNVDRIYKKEEIGSPTTDGYVYFGDLAVSTDYANKTCVIYDKDPYLMIFEVEVNDDIIEADIDEINYTLKRYNKTQGFTDIENQRPDECWASCRALRVKGDVELIPGKFRFAKLKSNLFSLDDNSDDKISAAFTMKIVKLRKDLSDLGEEKKLNLYTQIQWEQ